MHLYIINIINVHGIPVNSLILFACFEWCIHMKLRFMFLHLMLTSTDVRPESVI